MLFSIARVLGHSMEPTFFPNDRILVSAFPYFFTSPKKGDIVIFRNRNMTFVKRVAKIQNSKYFLTGDNKSDSKDSRSFGLVERKDIVGKVIIKL